MIDPNELYPNELYHHGVKGMKWGVRKAQPVSGSRGRLQSAKADYKSSKKTYNKSYNKAYSYSARHPISQFVSKKIKAESEARWDQAIKDAKQTNSAKSAYKSAKKNAKAEKKASIKRGEELYRRLNDPKEIRWNEDRNNRLIKMMSKKDWQDVERYKHDQNVKVYAATALTAIGGLGIAYLTNR